MAVARSQDAEPIHPRRIGELFAEEVAGDPAAIRLWVSTDGLNTKLWLQIEPVGREHELRFYGMAGTLYNRIPGPYFDLHLLSPRYYEEFVPGELIPVDSIEIPLSAVVD